MDGRLQCQDNEGGVQRGAATFQAAVFDRVAASATLRRSRQPSRLPQNLERRHRAFSILQSLVGVILALLGLVTLAWGQTSPSPLSTAVGVWSGPTFLLAGQIGCQAGRNGNSGRSRRAALRWSMTSLTGCLTSFFVGVTAIVIRAKRISLPPAPVAASDCVNLSLICTSLCMSAAQGAFAALAVWHCCWGYEQPKTPTVDPGICAVTAAPLQSNFQQLKLDASVTSCPSCMQQRGQTSWTESRTASPNPNEVTPPPSYQEWRSMTLGPDCLLPEADSMLPESPAGPECQSMIVSGDKQNRRKKNLRVHWKL